MNAIDPKFIPSAILHDSLLATIAAAYFSVGKKLERKTQCSATRGFILAALRDGAELNANQIAVSLGLDRTVVHRSLKTMLTEGLISEKPAKSGRALIVRLTAKGQKYREFLIAERKAADARLARELTAEERSTLVRLLNVVAEVEF